MSRKSNPNLTQLNLSMTVVEKVLFEIAFKESKCSTKANFQRALLKGYFRKKINLDSNLSKQYSNLHKIGSNINQIARSLNKGEALSSEEVLKAYNHCTDALMKYTLILQKLIKKVEEGKGDE
jgi:hypothetical protein